MGCSTERLKTYLLDMQVVSDVMLLNGSTTSLYSTTNTELLCTLQSKHLSLKYWTVNIDFEDF